MSNNDLPCNKCKSQHHPADECMKDPERLIDAMAKDIDSVATHILHYHDKEGRTTEEQVIHKARFEHISKRLLKIVLQSVQRGEVIECISHCDVVVLKPEFQRFMEEK